jgi:hypothetical protein
MRKPSRELGGRALGERAWAPFEWAVPAELKGTETELAVTVYTSVAPLFGDWQDPEAAGPSRGRSADCPRMNVALFVTLSKV